MGRDTSLPEYVAAVLFHLLRNVTFGAIGCLITFLWSVWSVIISYEASPLTAVGFYVCVAVAALSLIATFFLALGTAALTGVAGLVSVVHSLHMLFLQLRVSLVSMQFLYSVITRGCVFKYVYHPPSPAATCTQAYAQQYQSKQHRSSSITLADTLCIHCICLYYTRTLLLHAALTGEHSKCKCTARRRTRTAASTAKCTATAAAVSSWATPRLSTLH
jgi:hypothetical protein